MTQHSGPELRAIAATLRGRALPEHPGVLRAEAVDDGSTWLAIDQFDRPSLLVRERSRSASEVVSMRFAHVLVKRHVRCDVVTKHGSSQAVAAVFECDSIDADIQDYFLRLMVLVLDALTPDATPDEFEAAIRRLRELLAATDGRSREITGLWGELFTIVHGADPEYLARAWHVGPVDPFDFVDADAVVEVKATQGVVRRHRFRDFQLSTEGPPHILVLSYLLTPSDTGPSVLDLLDEALPAVGLERSKVETLVLGAVRDQLDSARRIRFSPELALATRSGYPASQVPGLRPPYPEAVSRVSFDVDLTNAEPGSAAPGDTRHLWTTAVPEQYVT